MVAHDAARRAAIGLAGSVAIAWVAARHGALTKGGALAAVAAGTTTCAAGGVGAGSSLIAFFVSSSAWSRVGRARKSSLATIWEKGDRRDAWQVIANGGVACVCLAASARREGTAFRAGAAAALAVAAADTWATELGSLSRAPARLITSGAVVPRGTSGAITIPGCLAALAGAVFTAAWFWLCEGQGRARLRAVLSTGLCGLAGSLLDSLLGATLQARYRCPTCLVATERRLHSCGTATILVGGVPWFRNDVVNLVSTAAGAMLGMALAAAVGAPRRRSP